jgi:hypothetical protein
MPAAGLGVQRVLQIATASYPFFNKSDWRKEHCMSEITSTTHYPLQTVSLSVDDPGLNLASASALAKQKARAIDRNAMMLSYHSGKTGEFWPNYDCGGAGCLPWMVFAESRGYNLKIDINGGEFEFFYLRF